MSEINLVRHRIRTVAFGWSGTLLDELSGMQETLATLVGPLRGRLDLREMAEHWYAELRGLFEERYLEWSYLACEALSTTCLHYGVPDPQATERDIQRWVQRWPLYEDHTALGRLGRRYKCALISQMDGAALATCVLSASRSFDYLISSDLARAYKPSPGFFKLMRVQLRLDEPNELLVVSANPELDLEPARAEGYQTALIVRDPDDPDTSNLGEIIRLLG
ncbi:MAG: hypothetical protein JW797_00535 [Bradymonadales bacterium]|nr:hypothetical protein [Bradymonadales bacterium]